MKTWVALTLTSKATLRRTFLLKTPETEKFFRIFCGVFLIFFLIFCFRHPELIFVQNKQALLVPWPWGLGLSFTCSSVTLTASPVILTMIHFRLINSIYYFRITHKHILLDGHNHFWYSSLHIATYWWRPSWKSLTFWKMSLISLHKSLEIVIQPQCGPQATNSLSLLSPIFPHKAALWLFI
jgi:hypothetical protein